MSVYPTRDELLTLFKFRCARCSKVGNTVTIHEIIPRSLRPKDWQEAANRIALCPACHEWAHKFGTRNSRDELLELRSRYPF
jgi:5-methylcytosine-specific restriction endonuclease McrA